MKRILSLSIFALTGAMAPAQVLVHDGFETYPIDKSFVGGPWTLYGYDFDTMGGGFVRGEYQGIKPYEGKQMYGIASGLDVNDTRSVTESRSTSQVEPPATEVSIAFFVAPENARCHNLIFAGQRGGSADLKSIINLGTGAWSFVDDEGRQRTGLASVPVGKWSVIKHRYDWAINQITVSLNGIALTTGFARHSLFGNNRATGGYVAVSNRVVAGAAYAYPAGGPPLYVDDYRLSNVPEPSTITIITASLLPGAVLSWRRRRK